MKKHYHALNTDLYELTMAAGYFEAGHNDLATFDMFARDLPPSRNYLVAAGIAQALEYIRNFRFTPEEVDYLRSLDTFQHISDDFFDYLRDFRFTGEVYSVEEGEIVFPGESVLQVRAPVLEAQILETYLLSTIQFQTMIASKAARVVDAAQYGGRQRAVLEFGSRRAHGTEAGVLAGRAAFIGGCKGTSNTLSGFLFKIPVSGTMAHSWVMSFDDEEEAFKHFYNAFKEQSVFLVDTYDSLQGTQIATHISKQFKGIRLDSADLVELSKKARKILDEAGEKGVLIFASGDLNEYKIYDMLSRGAPVDAFGVGTQLSTSADAPYLQMVYKLSEYGQKTPGKYKIKLSKDKQTLPGLKQVYRFNGKAGKMTSDKIALWDEELPNDGVPLIRQVIKAGKMTGNIPSLNEIREKTKEKIGKLPPGLRDINRKAHYKVEVSDKLRKITDEIARELREKQRKI